MSTQLNISWKMDVLHKHYAGADSVQLSQHQRQVGCMVLQLYFYILLTLLCQKSQIINTGTCLSHFELVSVGFKPKFLFISTKSYSYAVWNKKPPNLVQIIFRFLVTESFKFIDGRNFKEEIFWKDRWENHEITMVFSISIWGKKQPPSHHHLLVL